MSLNKIMIGMVFILFIALSAFAKERNNDYITLNFKDMPVQQALQFLAEFAKVDIIVNDSVSGHITLHMQHVFWRDALDIILKTQGLDYRTVHDTLLIGPMDEMVQWDALTEASEPLVVASILLRYANAADIMTMLKNTQKNNAFLSSRGHIAMDKRTNALFIQDTASKMAVIRQLIESLDTPVRQVLIEARIVNVNRDIEKNLGIRFSMSKVSHVNDRLNVDFSSVSSSGNVPASIGLALAKLGGGILLDLELSALESEGEGKIISSPRLVTADQQSAYIESGEEIPYQESTSSGATAVVFKKAVLRLKVTPHITGNDKIMMALTINQGMPNGILVNGVPEVTTKAIQTNVLVNNGQTLVLGGIYRQDKTSMTERIPFLSSLPGIGSIFQRKSDRIVYEELLIFITPKIIDEEK